MNEKSAVVRAAPRARMEPLSLSEVVAAITCRGLLRSRARYGAFMRSGGDAMETAIWWRET